LAAEEIAPMLRIDPADLVNTQAFLAFQLEGLDAPDAMPLIAWQRFHRKCDRFLRRMARKYRLSLADADDLLQEVWLEAFGRPPEFRWILDEARLPQWLFTLLRSKISNASRRRRCESLPTEALDQFPAACTGDADEEMEKAQRQQLLTKALRQLKRRTSRHNYAILHMQFVQGLAPAHVAQKLGLTVRRLRFRRIRLLRQLRQIVGQLEPKQFSGIFPPCNS
jgi:RNA polymerase sigma factor (sigma-70 family)